MHVEITSRPAYAIAYVKLQRGQSVYAEAGALVAMSGGVEAAATLSGGVLQAVARRLVTQETLITTRFTAHVDGAWVSLSPRYPGDVTAVEVSSGAPLVVQSGSFLAHSEGVGIAAAVGNLQSVALREGASVVLAEGDGTIVIAAYGGLERFDLRTGEKLVVDSGHIAAWSASLGFKIGPLKGAVSSVLTGEGIVGEFTGPGSVFVQTRAEQQLRSWLLPGRAQNSGG